MGIKCGPDQSDCYILLTIFVVLHCSHVLIVFDIGSLVIYNEWFFRGGGGYDTAGKLDDFFLTSLNLGPGFSEEKLIFVLSCFVYRVLFKIFLFLTGGRVFGGAYVYWYTACAALKGAFPVWMGKKTSPYPPSAFASRS